MSIQIERYSAFKVPVWGYVALSICTALGLYATYTTLTEGHIILNSTQHIPWGIWVAAYLFAISFSIGSYLIAAMYFVFGLTKFKPIRHLALMLALIGFAIAGFFIVLDLGHPIRMTSLFSSFNFKSPMAWMGIYYSLFAVGLTLQIAISIDFAPLKFISDKLYLKDQPEKKKQLLKVLTVIGVAESLLVLLGEGTIFAVASARPGWFGGLYPALLVITGIAAGGGLLALIAGTFTTDVEEKGRLLRTLLKVSLAALVVTFLFLILEASTKYYSGIEAQVYPWNQILFGDYWYTFWIFQLLLGFIFPIYVLLKRSKGSIKLYQCAGAAIAFGLFCLRMNIVMPAQSYESLPGFSEANMHWRFSLGYSPSFVEYALLFGGMAMFAWLYMFLSRYIPVNDNEPTNQLD